MLEQIHAHGGVFIALAPNIRSHAPIGAKLFAFEHAEGDIRIAYVYRKEHAHPPYGHRPVERFVKYREGRQTPATVARLAGR